MSEETKQQPEGLAWKWVVVATVVGLIIVGLSYYLVAPTFQSAPIQALIMMVGFLITGVITGYFSPGVTIREPALGGGFVMVIMLTTLYITGAALPHSQLSNIFLLIVGMGFSWVGGWAGEKLQGDGSQPASSEPSKGLEWLWVWTGVAIGFALNVLIVFLGAPILKFNLNYILATFLGSFVITGFIVAYKSPGVTLKEPALAGVISVVLEWLFIEYSVQLHVEPKYLVSGLLLGFLFSLCGAWIGEKYQASVEQARAS